MQSIPPACRSINLRIPTVINQLYTMVMHLKTSGVITIYSYKYQVHNLPSNHFCTLSLKRDTVSSRMGFTYTAHMGCPGKKHFVQLTFCTLLHVTVSMWHIYTGHFVWSHFPSKLHLKIFLLIYYWIIQARIVPYRENNCGHIYYQRD